MFLFCIFYSLSASSQCQTQELTAAFGAQTLQALKQAHKAPAAYLAEEHEYLVDIFYHPKSSKHFALVGELHKKDHRGYQLGANIISQFNLRLIEFLSAGENSELQRHRNPRRVTSQWHDLEYGSSLEYALKTGDTVEADSRINPGYARDYQEVMNVYRKHSGYPQTLDEPWNISLETGYDLYNLTWHESSYIHLRDERMAKAIDHYMQALSSHTDSAFLGLVGIFHQPGISSRLAQMGFQKCALP